MHTYDPTLPRYGTDFMSLRSGCARMTRRFMPLRVGMYTSGGVNERRV